jgi:hypothetical protein
MEREDGDVEQGKGSKGNNVMERDSEEQQDKETTGPFNVLLLGEFGYFFSDDHQAPRRVCVRER